MEKTGGIHLEVRELKEKKEQILLRLGVFGTMWVELYRGTLDSSNQPSCL